MTRLENVTEAIENIKSIDPTNENLKQIQIALLGHIAVSLAVIADKVSENQPKGELQDTAYQRGLEEGKKAFDLLDAERNSEYQRGFEDGKAIHEKGCEGCEYTVMGSDTAICSQCCNAYHNQWTAKQTDDKSIDIIRNGIHNWVTELNVKLDDIASILEEMKS